MLTPPVFKQNLSWCLFLPFKLFQGEKKLFFSANSIERCLKCHISLTSRFVLQDFFAISNFSPWSYTTDLPTAKCCSVHGRKDVCFWNWVCRSTVFGRVCKVFSGRPCSDWLRLATWPKQRSMDKKLMLFFFFFISVSGRGQKTPKCLPREQSQFSAFCTMPNLQFSGGVAVFGRVCKV